MLCRTYTPGPPLSDFVASFWLIEGCVLPHAFERVLPSGNMFGAPSDMIGACDFPTA